VGDLRAARAQEVVDRERAALLVVAQDGQVLGVPGLDVGVDDGDRQISDRGRGSLRRPVTTMPSTRRLSRVRT